MQYNKNNNIVVGDINVKGIKKNQRIARSLGKEEETINANRERLLGFSIQNGKTEQKPRGTQDQMFIMKQIIDNSFEFQRYDQIHLTD